VIKQLKYYFQPVEILIMIFASMHSIQAVWITFITLDIFIIGGDFLFKDDNSKLQVNNPFLLNLSLYSHFPLLLILIYFSITLIHNEASSVMDYVGVTMMLGLTIGSAAINVGHELTHQTKNPLKLFLGNWLFGIACEPFFVIEHVYGHHKNVGLLKDPATARRGENIYSFLFRSTFYQMLSAWKIESHRLEKKGFFIGSLNNKIIQSVIRSIIVLVLVFLVADITGLVCYIISIIWAKILLETINYVEHYGLIRVEGKPVQPRHSWNTNASVSSMILFNLTRHSHHHEKASLEFWKLKPYQNAPEMPYGYLTMAYMTLIFPWLFKRVMKPKLEHWDQHFASESEKQIIRIL
jgi:hypothetical protein